MASLLLPNKITGLDSHYRIFSDGSYVLCENIHDEDIVIGTKAWRAYVKTTCEEAPCLLPEVQKKALQTILALENEGKSQCIAANLILSQDQFQVNLERYLVEASEFLRTNPPSYFENFLKQEMNLLEKMEPCFVSEDLFNKYRIEDNQGLVSTFTPNKEGFAKKVKYDGFKSPTGRLVVSEGPHILTINKKYRDMIQSPYEDGAILSIDYVALEPSVLLGRTPKSLSNWLSSTSQNTRGNSNDVYQSIADILFDKGLLKIPLDRAEAKAITLRTLYGAQEDLIGQIVQGKNSVPLHDFLFEVRELFDINNLLHDLQAERRSNKGRWITNHFDRRIPTDGVEDYKLINYWTQSTAVDVALLGFAQMVEALPHEKIHPLFVLHDAIFLDIANESIPKLKEAILKAKTIPRFPEDYFRLKVTVENQTE